LSILIGLNAGIVAFNISLFVIGIFGFIISKLAFSERISFRRRM
jgi:type IV secretory pathway TrbD component